MIFYCENNIALDESFRRGLITKSDIVRSSSPYVLDNSNFKTENAQSENPELMSNMSKGCLKLASLLENIYEDTILCSFAARLLLTYVGTIRLALNLNENDLFDKRHLIFLNSEKNFPWIKLLSNNKNLIKSEVRLKNKIEFENKKWPSPNKLVTWKTIGIDPFIFELGCRLSIFLPKALSKGEFIVLRANPLLREAGTQLLLKRYQIRYKKSVKINYLTKIKKINIFDKEIISNMIYDSLNFFIPEFILPTLCEEISKNMTSSLHDYIYYKNNWEKEFRKNKITGIMTNLPKNTEEFSIISAAKNKDIPTFTFQHGISREITHDHIYINALYENVFSDYFFSYGDSGAIASYKAPLNKAKIIACGPPQEYKRLKKVKWQPNKNFNLLYLSTSLLRNGNDLPYGSDTNKEILSSELNIINNILGKTNKKVLYKSYPQGNKNRYIDPDISLIKANNYKNIEIYDGDADSRFFFGKSDLIITSRATSTIAWAIMTGTPTIYIDIKDQRQLSKEVYKLFEDSIFLFRYGETNWNVSLLNLINLPIKDILEKWNNKRKDRDTLIDFLFKKNNLKAGKVCSEEIIKIIN
ncbi:hypothetical protein OAK17_07120 [Alphaproteobacteria bacterium]|nr:hypothetical protein [Alphaproteobacteria bacterium]